MSENHKNIKHRIPVAAIVCASLAVIALAVSAILMHYTSIPHTTIIVSALGVYVFLLFWVALIELSETV